ncbi:MAG: aspartate kinase [Candidatus Riflebacteria bacterium]
MFANGDVLIQKFGGSSMGSVDRINRVAERIAEKARRGSRLVVVVSAMADTTDDLIGLMNKVSIDVDRREYDQMLATGEMVSASLAAAALQKLGIRARSFNAFNLHLLSELQNDEYNIVQVGRGNNLARFLEPGSVAVVAGFQGITVDGDLTTLGRGGSDLTAVVLAAELGQKVCEKFTDEEGIYTADPRMIPQARKIWHLDYEEMLELAAFGNGILHPRAISCARDHQIRIHVRSSFSRAEGSVVGPDGDPGLALKSITADGKLAVVKIQGASSPDTDFYQNLAQASFKPVLQQWIGYNQQNGSLRLAFRKQDAFEALPFCWEEAFRLGAEEVVCHANLLTVSLVGCGVNTLETRLFLEVLDQAGIVPVLWQHDRRRLSIAVEKEKSQSAVAALHNILLDWLKISS